MRFRRLMRWASASSYILIIIGLYSRLLSFAKERVMARGKRSVLACRTALRGETMRAAFPTARRRKNLQNSTNEPLETLIALVGQPVTETVCAVYRSGRRRERNAPERPRKKSRNSTVGLMRSQIIVRGQRVTHMTSGADQVPSLRVSWSHTTTSTGQVAGISRFLPLYYRQLKAEGVR